MSSRIVPCKATNVKYICMTENALGQGQFRASSRGCSSTVWKVTFSVNQYFNIYRETSTPALPHGSIVFQVGNIQLYPSGDENREGLLASQNALAGHTKHSGGCKKARFIAMPILHSQCRNQVRRMGLSTGNNFAKRRLWIGRCRMSA